MGFNGMHFNVICINRSSPCALRSNLTDGQVDTPSEEQGRISATSATRELDELMACLSDFKVQSNVSVCICVCVCDLLGQCK